LNATDLISAETKRTHVEGGNTMRIAKEDIAVKVDASPGAVARQKTDFGDATEYGPIAAEHYRIAAGTDLSPLLQGLEDDLCQAPHWGYLIEGELIVSFKDGTEENPRSGDLFYWPPGHTIRAEKDTEMVLFSPQHEHTPVLDHLNRMLGG
jgi:hypothetical protein